MPTRADRIVVFGGSGAQGQETVRRLAVARAFKEIVIADLNPPKGVQVANGSGPSVEFQKLDINDRNAVIALMGTAKVVVNEAGPYRLFGSRMIDAAIEAGVDYVDINDDALTVNNILADSTELDRRAKTKGLHIIIGLGSNPGISNLLAKQASLQMDLVEGAYVRMAPPGSSSPAVVASLLDWFSGEVGVLRKGSQSNLPAFTEAESVDFAFLNEPRVCYLVGFPNSAMLARSLKGIQEVDTKMGYPPPFIDLLRQIFQWGFHNPEPIQVGGVSISPRQFMLSYLASPEGAKLLVTDPSINTSAIKVIVKGRKDDRQVRVSYDLGMKKGTGSKLTGMPPQIAAELLAAGGIAPTGILIPEDLDPRPFLAQLSKLDVMIQTSVEEIYSGIRQN